MNLRHAALLLSLTLAHPLLNAAEPAACSAQETEIATLKARILELEAATRPASPAAALPPKAPGSSVPGLAPKPAKEVVVTEVEPYSRSGCRPGLFQDIPDAVWMDESLWADLEKGMSPVEVERLLGPEHYDTAGGRNIKWEYGKCGSSSRAQLLFVNGKLADWRQPSN